VRAPRTRRTGAACASALLLGLGVACGDGSSLRHNVIAPPADNVAEVLVDYGLPNIGYVNGLFATVNVCVPGSTSECQAIDHLLVDTGSSGLRLLGSVLTLSLPAFTNDSGVGLAECSQFISGSLWGPLRSADFSIANEQANNLAIQVIEESTYPMPADCTGTDISTPDLLGANGILGVGSSPQDCGPPCAAALGTRSENPGLYYACTSAAADGCQAAAVPVSQQLSNPVAFFSQDNNGVIFELPAIPAEGAPSVTGSLVFGIGTRDNNGLEQASVIWLDEFGEFRTQYPTNGAPSLSFIDSGSNAIYFLDSSSTHIPTCSDPLHPTIADFYCPNSTLNLSAKIHDTSGRVTLIVNFSVANAMTLASSQDNIAFDNLAGPSVPPSGASFMPAYFDWGLPFYFGRNVFTAITGQTTPAGPGPFVAF
jgi:Protein of unknown function (DUF3443)